MSARERDRAHTAVVIVLEELDRRYGSVAGYLRAGGPGDETIERGSGRLKP